MSTEHKKKRRSRGSDNKVAETITAKTVANLSDISEILSEKFDPISEKIDGFT